MSRRRRSTSDPLALVGWVFADLLLGLSIVFLATQPGDPEAGAGPTTTTTAPEPTTTTVPPTTVPEPTTTTAPIAPGVDTQYRCIRIVPVVPRLFDDEGPGRDAYAQEVALAVEQRLNEAGLAGRRIGIVLVFGSSSDAGTGVSTAEEFAAVVLPKVPALAGAASRTFWGGGSSAAAPERSIELNVYPLVGPGEPRLETDGGDC